MNSTLEILAPSLANAVGDSTPSAVGNLTASQKLAFAVAAGATLASLGIAAYAGWQSGGLLIERIMRIALAGIAVLVVHWLPVSWSTFRGIPQFFAFVLWVVATVVVLFGQATFLATSQRHAGDLRAAEVPAPILQTSATPYPARSRTDVAHDVAKVSAELIRAQTQPCVGDCPALKVRRARLAAEVAALGVEADEAKRLEAREDRRLSQAERDDDRREALRADPVASPFASWLGTTENRLQLIIGIASAVVLEGAAILGWAYITVAPGRDSDRGVVASDQIPGALYSDPATEVGESGAAPSEEDQLLAKIRAAVVAGDLKPTQSTIRDFLRCGQPKAGKLNRLYMEKFGSMEGIAVARGQDATLSRLAIEVVK